MVEAKVKNSADHSYNGHPYSQFRQFIKDESSGDNGWYKRFVSATRFNTFTGVSYYSPQDSYVKLSYKDNEMMGCFKKDSMNIDWNKINVNGICE